MYPARKKEKKTLSNHTVFNAEAGLRALFCDHNALRDFKQDCPVGHCLESFIAFAARHGVIQKHNRETFEAFLGETRFAGSVIPAKEDITFAGLIEDPGVLRLEKIGSVRNLANSINKLLLDEGVCSEMQVSNTMFSRLKKEPADSPKKRNTLRSLAFWLGGTRPDLAATWNFRSLLKACSSRPLVMPKYGARVGFHLFSHGDTIEPKIVKWLEKNINDYLDSNRSNKSNRVREVGTTTFWVDFPVKNLHAAATNHPGNYDKCSRDAVAIAHQIFLQWLLSRHINPRRTLRIAIIIGNFSEVDIHLKTLLNAQIAGNPAIRVSDDARLAIIANDIRAQFSQVPQETEIYTGEVVKIWWITGLASHVYWDFIPVMLEDKALEAGSLRDTNFREQLYFSNFPYLHPSDTGEQQNSPSLETLLRYPQNLLLAIETAKVLVYRGNLWDANEIIRILLGTDPSNLLGRTLRMMIYWNLALLEKTYSSAKVFYQRAEEEAHVVHTICSNLDEDFYCEWGLGKAAHAMHILRLIRKTNVPGKTQGDFEYETGKYLKPDDVIAMLKDAEDTFLKGAAISPWGHRSYYYLITTKSFRRILECNRAYFSEGSEVYDKENITVKTALELFRILGWVRDDYPLEFTEKMVMTAINLYDSSVLLRSFKPAAKLAFAVVIWDFSPQITVGSAKVVLNYLNEALALTKAIDQKILLYAVPRLHSELLSAAKFCQHIEKFIREVKKIVKTDLETKGDDELIHGGKPIPLKLHALNVCFEPD